MVKKVGIWEKEKITNNANKSLLCKREMNLKNECHIYLEIQSQLNPTILTFQISLFKLHICVYWSWKYINKIDCIKCTMDKFWL